MQRTNTVPSILDSGSVVAMTIEIDEQLSELTIIKDTIELSRMLGNIPIRVISDNFNGVLDGTMHWPSVAFRGNGRSEAEYYEARYPEQFGVGICPHLTDR